MRCHVLPAQRRASRRGIGAGAAHAESTNPKASTEELGRFPSQAQSLLPTGDLAAAIPWIRQRVDSIAVKGFRTESVVLGNRDGSLTELNHGQLIFDTDGKHTNRIAPLDRVWYFPLVNSAHRKRPERVESAKLPGEWPSARTTVPRNTSRGGRAPACTAESPELAPQRLCRTERRRPHSRSRRRQ
jgi:hypothetical protein